jgi:O-antigen/teichoic acid export membrane protein
MFEKRPETLESLRYHSQFIKRVRILIGATAGSQLLLLLASPLLTRLFSPEDFGILATYASLVAFIGVFSCLRYEHAIVIEENSIDATNIVLLSLTILLIIVSITSAFIIFYYDILFDKISHPSLADSLWLLPAGILLSSLYNIFNFWALRNKNFSTIASTRVHQSILTILIQIIFFKIGYIALLVGYIAGQSFGFIRLVRSSLITFKSSYISYAVIKKVMFRYKKFPVYDAPSAMINSAAWEAPTLLLAILFNPALAGFYMLANRIVQLPKSLITGAVSETYYAHAAEEYRQDSLVKLTCFTLKKLSEIIIPMMMIVILISPNLFDIVFGSDWKQAGVYAQILAAPLTLMYILIPFTRLFSALSLQEHGLFFHSMLLIFRIFGLLIGFYYNDPLLAIILLSLGTAFAWSGFLIWLSIILKIKLLILIMIILNPVMTGALISGPIIFSLSFNLSSFYLCLSVLISALIFSNYFYIKFIKVNELL